MHTVIHHYSVRTTARLTRLNVWVDKGQVDCVANWSYDTPVTINIAEIMISSNVQFLWIQKRGEKQKKFRIVIGLPNGLIGTAYRTYLLHYN